MYWCRGWISFSSSRRARSTASTVCTSCRLKLNPSQMARRTRRRKPKRSRAYTPSSIVADDGWKAAYGRDRPTPRRRRCGGMSSSLLSSRVRRASAASMPCCPRRRVRRASPTCCSIYTPADQPETTDDTTAAQDRCKLELRVALASSGIHATISREGGERYSVRGAGRQGSPRTERHWPDAEDAGPSPSMRMRRQDLNVGAEAGTTFTGASFESLTTFFAFDLRAEFKGTAISDRFVLNVPAEGMPDDRRERVLRALLKNRSRVLQFLLFLLAEEGDIGAYLAGKASGGNGEGDPVRGLLGGTSLLEPLLTALHRDSAEDSTGWPRL